MANLTHADDHEFGRVYTMSDAHSTRASFVKRSSNLKASDCVCRDAEGNIIRVIATRTAPTTRKRTTRTPDSMQPNRNLANYDHERLLQSLGSIHEGDS